MGRIQVKRGPSMYIGVGTIAAILIIILLILLLR